MSRIACASAFVILTLSAVVPAADGFDKAAAERGAKAVRGQTTMNPAVWSAKAYDNLWKQWGVTERPADYARAVQERYGLHPATYPNGGLPMGLHYTSGILGKGIVNDCMLCHSSVVAGQNVVGAANSALDLQSLFDDLGAADGFDFKFPFQFSYARGTVDPVNPVTYLFEFRDADLKLRAPVELGYSKNVASDPPAWWLLKRKATRNWTGGVKVNSTRVDMVNLLNPFNGPERIKGHEKTFADIHQFVLSVESPKYPFPVDSALAEKGRGVYIETCARCHGTHGPDGKYPSKVVDLKTLGTDPTLATALSKKNLETFNQSWFAKEKAPDGSLYQLVETPGYQAPPLDGVWATAPYLHNSSVPTLDHLLNSKARPKYWTRSYRSEREDYDAERVGWKITTLDAAPPANVSEFERRKTYDTTQPGRSNAGHTFGDALSDAERRALIEYLKTI